MHSKVWPEYTSGLGKMPHPQKIRFSWLVAHKRLGNSSHDTPVDTAADVKRSRTLELFLKPLHDNNGSVMGEKQVQHRNFYTSVNSNKLTCLPRQSAANTSTERTSFGWQHPSDLEYTSAGFRQALSEAPSPPPHEDNLGPD